MSTHPFAEEPKNNFHSGGVHPLVFGAFGETNGTTSCLITRCAQFLEAHQENSDVTTLSTVMHCGTAFMVILSQFRCTVGILATKMSAEILLRRVGLVRPSKAESAATAQPEHR